MTPKTILIIGAGPAGLSAADELQRLGYGGDIHIWESDPQYVGGISKTIEWDGYRFDIGGHRFFSKSETINARWKEWLGEDLIVRRRLSRIYYRNTFFNYPLKPLNALKNLGPLTAGRCVLSYAKRKAFPITPEASFSDWVQNRFGRQLFEIFFRSYTEKVWGMSCEEISSDWASQRIKGLSLGTTIKSALLGTKKGEIKTLIDSFLYPRLGPGMMWEAVAQQVQDKGATLSMNTRVTNLGMRGDSIFMVQGGSQIIYPDAVISSMPLQSLLLGLRPLPPKLVLDSAKTLQYRDFITVALVLDKADLFPDNWIYIHDASVKVGRIQNFGNWSPDLLADKETSCVGLEYFVSKGDAFWELSDEDIIKVAIQEYTQLEIHKEGTVIKGTVIRQAKAYPVYTNDYQDHRTVLRSFVSTISNLQIIGRNGMHRYNNQDHAMMTGMLAAQNILGADWDLENVNSDAGYHEELSTERSVPRPIQ